ncbi:DUF5687 family protein [Marinigracilibium pacificum]|uniref:ABC-2 type transport system permease protein n=1 Tax=Marinigracilibium pacificum TaxID=2729599 RepID=A0A848J300_9BACT|nr:DUF5687 family protein [Marinigracilibium pacificum]NMM48864.1 hypothetical protein [Marinigracilibium pacificum]
MLLLNLIKHRIQESVRAKVFSKNVAIAFVMVFLFLYFATIFIFLGFNLIDILRSVYPETPVLSSYFTVIIYAYFSEIMVRYFLMDIPAVKFQRYILHPFKRGQLVNSVLISSVFDLFYVFPLMVFIPFIYQYDFANKWIIWVFLLLLSTGNHFLALYLKKKGGSNPLIGLILLLITASVIYLDSAKILPITPTIAEFFTNGIENPWQFLAAGIYPVITYLLSYKWMVNHAYLDELSVKRKTEDKITSNLSFGKKYGKIGQLMELETRLILRNKRTKQTFLMSFFFLFYGLIFYANDAYQNQQWMLVFVAIFITSLFAMQHLQFTWSLESSYFDHILTNPISFSEYMEAKFRLIAVYCGFLTLLSMGYAFLDPKYAYQHLCAYIFAMGVLVPLFLYLSSFNKKKIDLGKSASFNFQGQSGHHYLALIPALVGPSILYWIISLLSSPLVGWLTLGFLGLIGISLRKVFYQAIGKRLEKVKYNMTIGFKEN